MRSVSEKRASIQSGELILQSRIVDASNATLIGEIDGIKIVYKPVAGERPLWDFPDGNLASREVAAYMISEAMAIHRVPYTILRDGPFGLGMVQEWIDVDEDLDLIRYAQSDDQQLRELALFNNALSELITAREIEALNNRIDQLVETSVFPMPSGDWPAIPWPPV